MGSINQSVEKAEFANLLAFLLNIYPAFVADAATKAG